MNDAKYTGISLNPITGAPTTRQVPPLDADNFEVNITATQPLFTGWRLTALRELASLGVDTAKIKKDTAIQDLVLNVKEDYFGILKAERLEKVATQAVEQLEAHLRVAQAFYDEGIIAKNELLQTEVQMTQARQDLTMAMNSTELAKSLFNKLLRRGLDAEVEIEDILDYQAITLTLKQCLERAELQRSEIEELSLNILSAEKGVKLTKSSYYPTVALVGNYRRESDEALLGADTGEDADVWTVTLKADWTFWEWGKKRSDVWASRAAVQAEENFRMNEERYKQQVATSTDVLDAQTLLTQARSNFFNALSEHNIAWAKLERAMGMRYEEK